MYRVAMILTLITLSAPACVGSAPDDVDLMEDGDPDEPGTEPEPDPSDPNPTEPSDDPPPPGGSTGSCPGFSSYALGLDGGFARHITGDPEIVSLGASVEGIESEPFEVFVDLYNGRGTFANGYAPGDYSLTGDEADPFRCGICVMYFRRDAAGNITRALLAEGGRAVIDELAPPDGKLRGTITDAPLREVDVETGADVPGGCTTSISEYTFTVDIVPAQ